MAMDNHAGHAPDPGHEVTDVPARPLAQVAIAIAVLVLGSFLAMFILFRIFNYYQPLFDDPPHSLADARQETTGPRIQIDPPRQKFDLRETEKQLLSTYGWVNKDVGLARIPVGRAMELLAEKKVLLNVGVSEDP